MLELMSAVSAQNEFELQENRIHVASGEEKRRIEKVVVILEPEFRKFGRIPGQICADPRSGLAFWIVGEMGIGVMEIITANAGHPAFLKSP